MPARRNLFVALGVLLMLASAALPSRGEVGDRAVTRAFLTLVAGEEQDLPDALELIKSTWQPSYLPMALDVLRLIRNPAASVALMHTMQTEVGVDHGYDLGAWQRGMWSVPEESHPRYAAFKGALYSCNRSGPGG